MTSTSTLLEELPPGPRAPVPGVKEALDRRRARSARGGGLWGYAALRWLAALIFGALLLALVVTLVAQSRSAFAHSGIGFLWSGTWDPVNNIYGAGVFVFGTLVTTLVALVLAVPVGVASAAFLAELAPRWLAQPLSVLIDLIAAVPSIVVGLWGLLVLTPVFVHHVEPTLAHLPLLKGLFQGPALGSSTLLAGVVLAVMILPTVVALSRSALSGVAQADREAALALGATRWQVVRKAVVPGARSGIEAAVTLATGRALGETLAVALVIGNRLAFPHSVGTTLLAPGATLGSAVINLFGGADPGLERSAVIGLVVYLLVISAVVNGLGQALLQRRRRSNGGA
ncbi:MAG: phosphate ABC transporter permease subunit PstC [Actinomycetota bacterium]